MCGIDARSVLGEPGAHLLEAFDLARLDLAGGHRTDVEQQVAVAAGAADERLQALLERLHRSSGFQAHWLQMVMQDSHGRLIWKPPMVCSGVSKSAGETGSGC